MPSATTPKAFYATLHTVTFGKTTRYADSRNSGGHWTDNTNSDLSNCEVTMPKVRIMTSDDEENPMCFSGNIDTAILKEFDYLPRIGDLVYWSGDLFYKVVRVYHEPIHNSENRKRQPWSTTIILKSPI